MNKKNETAKNEMKKIRVRTGMRAGLGGEDYWGIKAGTRSSLSGDDLWGIKSRRG